MRLDGRVAVVTGGAQGLGRQICVTLAEAGAAVVVNTRPGGTPAGAALDAIRRVRSAGPLTCEERGVGLGAQASSPAGPGPLTCEAVAADVADWGQAEALMNGVRERFGRLDILVNSAGISADSLLLEMSEQAWDRVFAVNVRGALNCIRAAAPHMIEQRAGAIANISSVVADTGSVGAANYAASKGAVNSLTRSAAVELARFGIRVNAIAPGVIETRLMGPVLDKRRSRLLERIPLRRFARADEVANAVLFLVSDRSSYITGEVVRVAGGMGLAS